MNFELTLIYNLKKWWRNSKDKDIVVDLTCGDKRTDLIIDFRLIGIINKKGKLQVEVKSKKPLNSDIVEKSLDDEVIRYLLRLELAAIENIIPHYRVTQKIPFEDRFKNTIPDLV